MPRGGNRTGAGRPRKALSKRLEEGIGKVSHRNPKVLAFPEKIKQNQNDGDMAEKIQTSTVNFENLPDSEKFAELPSIEKIRQNTLDWVTDAGCERFVSAQLIEDFAIVRRCYLECEYMCNSEGRATQKGTVSPYVKASLEYLKQSRAIYSEIWSIITQNSSKDYDKSDGNKLLKLLENQNTKQRGGKRV